MSNWLIDEENISSSWIDAKNRYCGLERYLDSGIIKGKYHMKIVFTLVKISYSIKNKIDITLQSSSTGYLVWIINIGIILMKKHLIFFGFQETLFRLLISEGRLEIGWLCIDLCWARPFLIVTPSYLKSIGKNMTPIKNASLNIRWCRYLCTNKLLWTRDF